MRPFQPSLVGLLLTVCFSIFPVSEAYSQSKSPFEPALPALGESQPFGLLGEDPDLIKFKAKNAVIYDPVTQTVLAGKDETEAVPVASMTKLLTAIVLMESLADLDKEIEITDEDVDRLKWSSSKVPVGAKLTRSDALLLALMSSDNRAANALARTSPYGLQGFIEQMNATAARIGAANAKFVDPTGLSPENKASALAMAKIAHYADQFEIVRKFSTLESAQIRLKGRPVQFGNSNPLIQSHSNRILLQKTGFIQEAGRCLVAKLQGTAGDLIVVLSGARTPSDRSSDMLKAIKYLP